MYFISLSSFCLSLLASSCWASAPPLLKARQFTNHYIAVASNDPDVRAWYPCSEFKRQRIEEAMVHTWAMAQAAAAALNVENAESSSSYCSWFGRENANPFTRNLLGLHHYQSVTPNLRPPGGTIIFQRWPPPYSIPSIPISSLVYVCPGLNSPEICPRLAAAATVGVGGRNMPGRPYGFTVIAICPIGFALPPYQLTLQEWAQQRDMASLATALLHEIQHTDEAVGIANFCYDHSYEANQCSLLSPSQKIENAQNFIWFALDAIVYPQRVAPAPHNLKAKRGLDPSNQCPYPIEMLEDRIEKLWSGQQVSSSKADIPALNKTLSSSLPGPSVLHSSSSLHSSSFESEESSMPSFITSSASPSSLSSSLLSPSLILSLSSSLRDFSSTSRKPSIPPSTTILVSLLSLSSYNSSSTSSMSSINTLPPISSTQLTSITPPTTSFSSFTTASLASSDISSSTTTSKGHHHVPPLPPPPPPPLLPPPPPPPESTPDFPTFTLPSTGPSTGPSKTGPSTTSPSTTSPSRTLSTSTPTSLPSSSSTSGCACPRSFEELIPFSDRFITTRLPPLPISPITLPSLSTSTTTTSTSQSTSSSSPIPSTWNASCEASGIYSNRLCDNDYLQECPAGTDGVKRCVAITTPLFDSVCAFNCESQSYCGSRSTCASSCNNAGFSYGLCTNGDFPCICSNSNGTQPTDASPPEGHSPPWNVSCQASSVFSDTTCSASSAGSCSVGSVDGVARCFNVSANYLPELCAFNCGSQDYCEGITIGCGNGCINVGFLYGWCTSNDVGCVCSNTGGVGS